MTLASIDWFKFGVVCKALASLKNHQHAQADANLGMANRAMANLRGKAWMTHMFLRLSSTGSAIATGLATIQPCK